MGQGYLGDLGARITLDSPSWNRSTINCPLLLVKALMSESPNPRPPGSSLRNAIAIWSWNWAAKFDVGSTPDAAAFCTRAFRTMLQALLKMVSNTKVSDEPNSVKAVPKSSHQG